MTRRRENHFNYLNLKSFDGLGRQNKKNKTRERLKTIPTHRMAKQKVTEKKYLGRYGGKGMYKSTQIRKDACIQSDTYTTY